MRTHMRAWTHTHVHAYMHTYRHTHRHAYRRAYTRACMHKHMVAHTQPHTGWRGVRRGRGRARGRGRGRGRGQGRGGPPFRAPANVRLASPADCQCTSQPTRTSRARVRLSERGCWVCTRAYVAPCLAAQPLRVSACPVAVCLSALSCLVWLSAPSLVLCTHAEA